MPRAHPAFLTAASFLAAASLTLGTATASSAQDGLDWSPCPDEPRLDCALAEMPLDHGEPAGPAMSIGVRRITAPDGARRQLWLLPGGPGDAVGSALARVADLLDDPQLELYGLDHRGTGDSDRLGCPAQESPDSAEGPEISAEEWPDCMAYIRAGREDLPYLTVAQSSMDLGHLIERTRREDIPVTVLGISFGSFWANRYLQRFPDQPAAVILDGIVPADWSFAEFDIGLDAMGRRLLAACGRDEECAARLGSNPVPTTSALLERLDEGHCPTLGIDADMARLIFGTILMVDAVPDAMIPVLVHRLDRCAWHDDMALAHLFRGVLGGISEPATHSPVLQRHVAMSELWYDTDPGPEEAEEMLSATLMTTRVSASFAQTWQEWPRYDAPPDRCRQAPFGGPMLLLHGERDPTMPADRLADLRAHYSGAAQSFVLIPEAGHVVLGISECARTIYRAFLENPEAPPDASCAGSESFLSYHVDAADSERLLGTRDAWGDDVSAFETMWFRLRYRWPPIAIGLLGAVFLLRASRGGGGKEPTDGTASAGRASTLKTLSALAVWAAILLGAYVVVASVPLLMDYRGSVATALALLAAALQWLAGAGLVKWIRRSPGMADPAAMSGEPT